jgi:hypothetical protein
MHAMLFAYVEARQLEIQSSLSRCEFMHDLPSMRDRLGRALITIGEQLLTLPTRPTEEVRPAA